MGETEDFRWNPEQSKAKANELTGRSAFGFGAGGAVIGVLAFIRHIWPDLLWPEANDQELIAAAIVIWGAVTHVYVWCKTYFSDKEKYQAIENAVNGEKVDMEKL